MIIKNDLLLEKVNNMEKRLTKIADDYNSNIQSKDNEINQKNSEITKKLNEENQHHHDTKKHQNKKNADNNNINNIDTDLENPNYIIYATSNEKANN